MTSHGSDTMVGVWLIYGCGVAIFSFIMNRQAVLFGRMWVVDIQLFIDTGYLFIGIYIRVGIYVQQSICNTVFGSGILMVYFFDC